MRVERIGKRQSIVPERSAGVEDNVWTMKKSNKSDDDVKSSHEDLQEKMGRSRVSVKPISTNMEQ